MPTCSVEGCARPSRARTYCTMHYQRWKRHGDPLIQGQIRRDDMRRFMQYVDKESSPDGCWLWTGAPSSSGLVRPSARGRGEFQVFEPDGERKKYIPYRWYYAQLHGPIPDGICCMHTCFNGRLGCVNPAHIRLGTNAENARMADRTGAQHHKSKVPDSAVEQACDRVRAGESRSSVARSLTAAGWPVAKNTVATWVSGRVRVPYIADRL